MAVVVIMAEAAVVVASSMEMVLLFRLVHILLLLGQVVEMMINLQTHKVLGIMVLVDHLLLIQ